MRISLLSQSIRISRPPRQQLRLCWTLGLACLPWFSNLYAQEHSAPPTSDLPTLSLAALQPFEEPPDQAYALGRGDEISIDFAGYPELSCKRTVGPDGRISIAPAGSILVADQTRESAAAAISSAMSVYYSHLSVTVGVDRYTSNRLFVLGAVEHPGSVVFDRPPTLLEVITQAGGFTVARISSAGALQASGPFSHPVFPERCAVYRGTDQVLWVDLQAMLDHGSSMAAIRLRRDDVVYVPAPRERYVSVLGQVQHPGAIRLEEDTTLAKLLAEAGGLTVQAGKSPNLQVIQPSTGKTRVVPFRALLQPNLIDLTLKSGDVLYVPESGFNQASYMFQQISPLLSVFTAAVLFQH